MWGTAAGGGAAGGASVGGLILGGFAAFDLLLYRDRGAEVASVLYDLTFGLLAMSGIPTAVALGTVAIAVYAHCVLPRPIGHLSTVAAVAHIGLLAGFVVHGGPFSLEGFAITAGIPLLLFAWILATALAVGNKR